jgi:hypothetical protein
VKAWHEGQPLHELPSPFHRLRELTVNGVHLREMELCGVILLVVDGRVKQEMTWEQAIAEIQAKAEAK